MFNIFKKKPVKQVTEPIKTIVTPLPTQDPIAYQVGKTKCGKTTLRLGNGYSSGTLTMNNQRVCKLIEMLTAALETEADAADIDAAAAARI